MFQSTVSNSILDYIYCGDVGEGGGGQLII